MQVCACACVRAFVCDLTGGTNFMINAERRIFMEMTIMKLLLLLLQLNCNFDGLILRILQYYEINLGF